MPSASVTTAATVKAGLLLNVRADRKSTRLNSSHDQISYAVFCLKKKKKKHHSALSRQRSHTKSSKAQISDVTSLSHQEPTKPQRDYQTIFHSPTNSLCRRHTRLH